MSSKLCDHCDAGEHYEDTPALCSETQMTANVHAWLCYNCRLAWMKYIRHHPIAKLYSTTMFRFEHYKIRLAATGEGKVEEGLRLLQEVDDIDDKMAKLAESWLEANNDEDL